jgi:hypothetical protein
MHGVLKNGWIRKQIEEGKDGTQYSRKPKKLKYGCIRIVLHLGVAEIHIGMARA